MAKRITIWMSREGLYNSQKTNEETRMSQVPITNYYEFSSWETMNLRPAPMNLNYIISKTRIFDEPTGDPDDPNNPENLPDIIYRGIVLQGMRISDLGEILNQYAQPYVINNFNIFGPDNNILEDDSRRQYFYIYYTDGDFSMHWKIDQVIVMYNWTYEDYPSGVLLSNPINSILDYRQWFLTSMQLPSAITQYVHLDGAQIDEFEPEDNSFMYTYVKKLSTLDYYAGIPSNLKTYEIEVERYHSYTIMDTCCRYCLYYMNRLGGWDSLVCQGRELQKDKLKRDSYKKNYVNNTNLIDFHKVDYLTTINETWSLNTSWLTNEQSERMIELLSSNYILLHDLVTDKIIGVNISNTTCEHKTYKNQGRRFFNYTIEVEASQPKYRV